MLAAVLGGSACSAGARVPRAKLVEAASDVKTATAIGATAHPESALYLQLARAGVHQAEVLIEDRRFDRAAHVLDRAEADAELAIATAREADARAAASAAQRRVDELRQEAP